MEIVRNGDTYVAIMNEDEARDMRRAFGNELDKAEGAFWEASHKFGSDSVEAEATRQRYLRAERNYVTVSHLIKLRSA